MVRSFASEHISTHTCCWSLKKQKDNLFSDSSLRKDKQEQRLFLVSTECAFFFFFLKKSNFK